MNSLRVCVVTMAALLAGPALAEGGSGVATFDGGSNSVYTGHDDGSVVNPDADDNDVDGAASGDDQGADDGGNSGAPDTYPA
jgi:hypothetical protein